MSEKDHEPLFRPAHRHRFRFLCHKDIPCFTKCCADLDLILTPYDIVRIKNRLGMGSAQFLEKYTEIRFDRHPRFPMVRLKMDPAGNRPCPFLSTEGCTIYKDRPGACRIYPLGRAALKLDREQEALEKFFFVQEAHCLGFQEDKEWTVEDWMTSEGLDEYNAMNDPWLEIVTSRRSLGPRAGVERKIEMFYLASYDLDTFRRVLFQGTFFDRFHVEAQKKEAMAVSDVALMRFAFKWLKFSLYGEKTLQIRSRERT